jgi:hypothetical protein
MRLNRSGRTNWLVIFLALVLTGSFFLPWVNWEGISLPGYTLPAGEFFQVSAEKFGLDNPYPRLDIFLKFFWLVPVAALAVIVLEIAGKKTGFAAVLAAVSGLALATVFILFTNILLMLGVGSSLTGSLGFGIYITIIAATGLILACVRIMPLARFGLVILGPLMAWISFSIIEKKIEKEEYDDSANVRSVYTVWAPDLIREFLGNDSVANAKYREQVITVTGRLTETEMPNDSTINLKISDPEGSYAIFPFHDQYLEKAKKLQPGDSVVIRASCSGGIYSEILETQIITFKRCALIQ